MQGAGLTARELYCRRGDRPLFGGLDLTLERGEVVVVEGRQDVRTGVKVIAKPAPSPTPAESPAVDASPAGG